MLKNLKAKIDLTKSNRAMRRLRTCARAKRTLSAAAPTNIEINVLCSITRTRFITVWNLLVRYLDSKRSKSDACR